MVRLKALTIHWGNLFWCLVGYAIKSWIQKLPHAEFAHNHDISGSSSFSHFHVVSVIVPRGSVDLSTLSYHFCLYSGATAFFEEIAETHARTIGNLESSSQKYKVVVDTHRHRLVFRAGDLVWVVLTKDRMPSHAYNKLKVKKIGTLDVLDRINGNAYRLRLPAYVNTSDVFNVKYLCHYEPPDQLPHSRANLSHPGSPDAASSQVIGNKPTT